MKGEYATQCVALLMIALMGQAFSAAIHQNRFGLLQMMLDATNKIEGKAYGHSQPKECPAENGERPVYLPHDSDCGSFYICDWGRPVLQQCPPSQHFDTNTDVCTFPHQANCGKSGEEHSGENNNGGDGGDCPSESELTCPEDNGEDVVQLPNPRNCSTFYKCDNGTPVLTECPFGLKYDSKLRVCDYPEKVNCVSCNGGGGDDNSGEGNGSNESGGDSGSGGNNGGDCPSESELTCPEDNGEDVVQLPNPRNCSTFYKCDNGTPVLTECPFGLKYDSKLRVCDYPEKVNCVSCNGGGGDDNSGEGNGSNESGGDSGSGGNNGGDCPSESELTCPEDNGEDVVQLPNPRNCSTFYKCDNGTPVLTECPFGLKYDSKLRVCDYPEKVNCVSCNGGGGDDNSGEGNGSNESGGDSGSGGNNGGDCPSESELTCPEDNGEDVVQLPNPRNCSTFYKCDHGTPVLMVCPLGLKYDSKLRVCDYPEKVNCVSCNGGGGDDNSGEGNGSNESGGDSGSGGNNGGDCPSESELTCPEDNGEDVVQLPNPRNCSTFYKCDNGTPVLMVCPLGLKYDSKLRVCDYPEKVNCVSCNGGGGDDNSGEGNGSNESGGDSGSGGNNGGDCPSESELTCPEDNGEDVVQLPNPRNCSTFYKCDNGTPVLMVCPLGLKYDSKLRVCDYPDKVNCVSCNGGGGDDNSGEGNGSNESGGDSGSGGNNGGDCPSESELTCPEDNGEDVVQLPNPRNCSTFYKCDNGTPVLMVCPLGLKYDSKLRVCDYPEKVNCVSCNGGGGDDNSGEGNGSNESGGDSGSGGNNGGDCPSESELTCPEDNGEDVVQLPNPRNCSTFYKCDNGTPVLTECPFGLKYDSKLRVCDYPEKVNCVSCNGGGGDDNSGEGNGSNESGGDSGSGGNNGGDCPSESELTCPEDNGEDVVQLPNPRNCSTFYKCDNGTPVLTECPFGLKYDSKLRVCDYPDKVNCVSCNGGGGDDNSGEGNGSNESGGDSGSGGNNGGDCPSESELTCPEDNGEDVVQLPNPRNCSTFYKCDNGTPVLTECPFGLKYDSKLRVCDYPKVVNCVSCNQNLRWR